MNYLPKFKVGDVISREGMLWIVIKLYNEGGARGEKCYDLQNHTSGTIHHAWLCHHYDQLFDLALDGLDRILEKL